MVVTIVNRLDYNSFVHTFLFLHTGITYKLLRLNLDYIVSFKRTTNCNLSLFDFIQTTHYFNLGYVNKF